MIDMTVWMPEFLQALRETFGSRIWFVGLQGSYGRGEATETSDIDVVVILDELSAADIQSYHAMLDTLSHGNSFAVSSPAKRRSCIGNRRICSSFAMTPRPSGAALTRCWPLWTRVP